ncbi:MAG: hypothetical protein RSA79_00810 [Oscillospiraceae bacterium]
MAQNYSSAQILSMQNDAIRRVQEMQRLAKKQVENSSNFATEKSGQNNTSTNKAQNESFKNIPINNIGDIGNIGNMANKENIQNADVVRSGFAGILDSLHLDEEKMLLIFLIILLVNEGADIMLILALGYILL